MRIEDEIKQVNFKNDQQKLYINMLFTANLLEYQSRIFFEKYELTPQQYNVLRILRGKNPEAVTVNYIRERMIDKSCDTSRIVERLRVKKLLERKANKTDRRAVDITISSKGLGLLYSIDSEIEKLEFKYFNKLNKEEMDQLNNLLDKLRG
ncbi:MAG: MarR family transcriptional regulator [Cytophagales bacterium]